MIRRFVPKEFEIKQPKIEVVEGYGNLKTIIKYPTPDPRDRVDEEYEDDGDHSE